MPADDLDGVHWSAPESDSINEFVACEWAEVVDVGRVVSASCATVEDIGSLEVEVSSSVLGSSGTV